MQTTVAIIGGGLSGLALATKLNDQGVDFQLFEARERFGGRIKTADGFDLGPSWFWPGQMRMERLVRDLGLEIYDQYASGISAYETENAEVIRDRGFASMQGSWRVRGGMSAIIDGLVAGLPADRLHLDHQVTAIGKQGGVDFANGETCTADTICLAIPPRVATNIAFSPALDSTQLEALEGVPTWMAGHAKFVGTYDTAFWRAQGMSGDAASRRGPLAEIHDASLSDDAGQAALFGFVGVPAHVRESHRDEVIQAAIAQLGRIFGPEALSPKQAILEDWAFEPFTATALDKTPLGHHPAYGMPRALRDVWDGRLVFSSTEVANDMGGFLEGALAAAEQTVRQLLTKSEAKEASEAKAA